MGRTKKNKYIFKPNEPGIGYYLGAKGLIYKPGHLGAAAPDKATAPHEFNNRRKYKWTGTHSLLL